jgi:Fe-S cluster assembly protein SufD
MSLAATDKNLTSQIISNIHASFDGSSDATRAEALEWFERAGLPTTKHEEYKYTPLTRELEKNFTFAGIGSVKSEADISSFLINGLDANVIVFINGRFSATHSRIVTPEAQLVIKPLKEALKTNATASQHFGKYITNKADGFVSWNTAEWGDGLFIHVVSRTGVELPLIIYYVNDASATEVSAITRNLIVTNPSSAVTVIEKFDSIGNGNHFQNSITEVFVAENSGFEFYSIQNDKGNRYQHALTEIHQERSSRVNTYTFSLNGKILRNNLQLALDGEGIESHMYGLYLLGGQTLADNHTVVDHRKANSFSNELYKGIMEESSKGVFNGKIYVRPQAQKTNAFQANRNILLGDKSSVNTKPQLEIWADDVKCSHGCTSGQLDEEAVFYLRTRGISKESAQAMMLYAFAGEIIDNIKHPVLKQYLDNVVSERLHKDF